MTTGRSVIYTRTTTEKRHDSTRDKTWDVATICYEELLEAISINQRSLKEQALRANLKAATEAKKVAESEIRRIEEELAYLGSLG